MNNYITTAKLNRYEKEKARHDVRYSSPRQNITSPLYLLITNYGPFFDIRKMNKFGDVKQVESDKNLKFYFVSYLNPEDAKNAINNYNYSGGKVKMTLLNEEEKNDFLRRTQDDSNYLDRVEYSKMNLQMNSEMLNKSGAYYIPNNHDKIFLQEEPKSNLQKFKEVFFNI